MSASALKPERFFRRWLASPLERHIFLRLALVAVLLSLLLLAVFLTAYRSQLETERSRASLGFNLLLQATLENAMLKRDVPELMAVVERLGRQPGIRAVMILNPAGEVRFASRSELLGRQLPALVTAAREQGPGAGFTADEGGASVLRSVNPVQNQPPCAPCHGPASAQPVNGVLVLDYDATELQRHAWLSALAFAGAGIVVLLALLAVLWRSLERRVLTPVALLTEASAALEQGRLDQRVRLAGDDELSTLGQRFNRMAERLEAQMALTRAHEAYLQDVLDSLPDGVRLIRVSDRQVVMVNRAYATQMGRLPEASVGLSCHQDSHGQDSPCVPTMVVCPLVALNSVGEHLKATHHHKHGNGEEQAVEIHAALVEIRAGEKTERYVVESVRDLAQAARISQEQRLSELGLLAAGIAHEIHNPLGSVRLAVQGLSRDIRRDQCSSD